MRKAHAMIRRRGMLAFVVYIALDLSSPFVPGAFNFNPDECVDGIHRASSPNQRADASALPARTPVVRLELPPPSPVRPLAGGRNLVLEWLVDARDSTRVSGDPPPLSEDH
jgi:hypothetical protein